MIKIEGRSLKIPTQERIIGWVGDNRVETRSFELTRIYAGVDLSEFDFKLDTEINGVKNIIDLDKSVNDDKITLTWTIRESHILNPGHMSIQIRAFSAGEEKWHSAQAYVRVQPSINAEQSIPDPLPSEFVQMEQRVTTMKEQAEASAQTATEQANRAQGIADEFENETLPAAIAAVEAAVDEQVDIAAGHADRAQGIADTFSNTTLPAAISAVEAAGQAKVDLVEQQAERVEDIIQEAEQDVLPELRQAIEDGIETKDQLGGSIQEAGEAKTALDGSISSAGTAKGELDGSITEANTAKGQLDDSIDLAGNAKTELDGSITTADQTKQALDESIATGDLANFKAEVESFKNDYETYKVETNSQFNTLNTRQQVVESILSRFDPYTLDPDVYGVDVDFENKTFTRLAGAVGKTPGADFDSILAFGGRYRCNLTDAGVEVAKYGDIGYTETGALTQAITIEGVTYAAGTPVQVMVKQPKFYYKVVPLKLEPITDGIGYHLRKARYYVSDTPKVGFKVHPAFVRNGVEVDKIYLSAYEGSIYDESAGTYLLADEQIADFNADKLSSIAYAKPASGLTQNLTRANTRKLAENRGAGWQQKDVLCASASQMLMMIEYAAFNMQSAIGLGVVNKPSGEGNESELTGATSNLGNASGMAVGTNGLVSISYRGEENFWGNIWKWIDGLNVYIDPDTRKTDAYWAAEDFSDDTGSSPYKHVGFNLAPNTDGYVSAFGWSEECDFLFLPTETLGNSALPVGDRFYNTQTGWRVARLGGYWDNGLNAGAFYWYVNSSAAYRTRNFGGGAVYVPQAS